MVYTVLYVVYQVMSLPVNFAGRSFDLDSSRRADAGVAARRPYPSVDIFLPICGEPLPVLRNTWEGVADLLAAYPGDAEAFVLDDGAGRFADAREAAESFGFIYVRRPNRRASQEVREPRATRSSAPAATMW